MRRGAARPAPAQRALTAAPDIADPDPDTLPDLVALPPWSMTTMYEPRPRLPLVRLHAWNGGPAPLVVEGFRRRARRTWTPTSTSATRTGTWSAGRWSATCEFDPHPAPQPLALPPVRVATRSIDARRHGGRRSRKQAYCLAPTDPIDLTVDRRQLVAVRRRLGSVCGVRSARWVREALQAGWGDTYFQSVPGQAFDVTNLPNGCYYVRIEVNPLGTSSRRTRPTTSSHG